MLRLILAISLAIAPIAATAAQVEELISEQARDTYGAELPAEGEFRISFQRKDTDEALMISAFWMDRATGQFLANAVTEGGDVARLQGLAILMLSLPVPARRLSPGEMIGEADIQMIDVPVARLSTFAVTERAALVGKEVKRLLVQGRPVMVQSVSEPLVITRGEKVSISLDDGRLALSAPGRALDDGYQGEEIRVVNLVSNKLVTGVARSGGRVEIVP